MNKFRTECKQLKEELRNTKRLKVVEINGSTTQEEELRKIQSQIQILTKGCFERLQKAEERFSKSYDRVKSKVELPYRNSLRKKKETEMMNNLTKKVFWKQLTQEQRVALWNNIKEEVKSLSIEEVLEQLNT